MNPNTASQLAVGLNSIIPKKHGDLPGLKYDLPKRIGLFEIEIDAVLTVIPEESIRKYRTPDNIIELVMVHSP